MKKSSIFFSITFIFVVSNVIMFLALIFLLDLDKKNYTEELNNKYTAVSRFTIEYLSNSQYDNILVKQLKENKIIPIDNGSFIEYAKKNGRVLQKISSPLGSSTIIVFNNYNYLYIETKNKKLLLKDDNFQPYRYHIIKTIFLSIFLFLLLLFVYTIKKLTPLKKLKEEIDKFAKGDLQISCKITGKDEISEVANAFDNAVSQIRKLLSSRTLFLRNIMHELKTPIAKGMIIAEMIDDEKQKKRLLNVFERLENLINELSAIERISSGSLEKNKKNFKLVDIIDEAIDISMVEQERIVLDIEQKDLVLNTDFKLFSIAIKNMIDNAFKYSPDKMVQIKDEKDALIFQSSGERLNHELSYYTEPFTQDTPQRGGFGLGLYIVDSILRYYGMRLGYYHKNNVNYFLFLGLRKIISQDKK